MQVWGTSSKIGEIFEARDESAQGATWWFKSRGKIFSNRKIRALEARHLSLGVGSERSR